MKADFLGTFDKIDKEKAKKKLPSGLGQLFY